VVAGNHTLRNFPSADGVEMQCEGKKKEERAEPVDQHTAITNPEVAVAGDSSEKLPSSVTVTTGGTVTGQAERRAERERGKHARERALATVAAEVEVTQAVRVAAFCNAHNSNAVTTTQGHTPRATGMAANQPLLAPPAQPWANRPTMLYARPTDTPDSIGPPPAAP
jgi:hypothetical protein